MEIDEAASSSWPFGQASIQLPTGFTDKALALDASQAKDQSAMNSETDREYAAARWLVDFDDRIFTNEELLRLRQWLLENAENCDAFLHILRSMRRTLILRRSDLPLMYGARKVPEYHAAEKLNARRPAEEDLSNEIINSRLGGVIRQLRVARGWSEEILAVGANINPRRLTNLEEGESRAAFAEAFRIARALEVPPYLLVREVENLLL